MTPDLQHPVLVVEDEMFIRMIAADALEERGFSVLEASDAQEALEILERTTGIGLIFTDINMPGKTDGLDLATEVAKRWPDIEIIVTSGGVRLDPCRYPGFGEIPAETLCDRTTRRARAGTACSQVTIIGRVHSPSDLASASL